MGEVFVKPTERLFVAEASGAGAAVYLGHPVFSVGMLYATGCYLVYHICDKVLYAMGIDDDNDTRKIISLAVAIFGGTAGTWKAWTLLVGQTIALQPAIHLSLITFGIFAAILWVVLHSKRVVVERPPKEVNQKE